MTWRLVLVHFVARPATGQRFILPIKPAAAKPGISFPDRELQRRKVFGGNAPSADTFRKETILSRPTAELLFERAADMSRPSSTALHAKDGNIIAATADPFPHSTVSGNIAPSCSRALGVPKAE
jgi:hypothetical protein